MQEEEGMPTVFEEEDDGDWGEDTQIGNVGTQNGNEPIIPVLEPEVVPLTVTALEPVEKTMALSVGDCAHFTDTGIAISPATTYEQWELLSYALMKGEKVIQWAVGDCLLWGEAKFGEMASQVMDAYGYAESTLRNYMWVASKIPPDRRREGVDFTHHKVVAGLKPKEQDAILDRIAADLGTENEWSVRDVQEAVKLAEAATTPEEERTQEQKKTIRKSDLLKTITEEIDFLEEVVGELGESKLKVCIDVTARIHSRINALRNSFEE
jgi:lysyl-tRNA synthetase class I